MGDLLDIIGRLERIPGPVALATLLEGEGAGSRRILESAGGAPGTALEEAVQGVLVSGRSQVVHVAGRPVWFDAGETIHTENSYKHTPERLTALAARAGWHVLDQWTDPDGWFALFRLT